MRLQIMKIKLSLVFMILLLLLMGASYASDVNQTDDQISIDEDASIEVISAENQDTLSTDGDSFTDLQDEINANDNVILDKNYTFDESKDSLISINKQKTIDGNGHAIDANGKSNIFNVDSTNVTFKNIVFLNGNTAITFSNVGNAILENCKFINSPSEQDVIYFSGGNLTIKNCEFINVSLININAQENVNLSNIEIRDSQTNSGLIYIDAMGNLTLEDILIENVTGKTNSQIVGYDDILQRDIWMNITGDANVGLYLISGGEINLSNVHVNGIEHSQEAYLSIIGSNLNLNNILIENSAISNSVNPTFNFKAVEGDVVINDFILKNITNPGVNTTRYSSEHRKYYYEYDSAYRGGNGISVYATRNAKITNLNAVDIAGGNYQGFLYVDVKGNLTFSDVSIDNLYLPMDTYISYNSDLDLEIYNNETSKLSSGIRLEAGENVIVDNVKINRMMSGQGSGFFISSDNATLTNVAISDSCISISSYWEFAFNFQVSDNLVVDNFILDNISLLDYNCTYYEYGKYVWNYRSFETSDTLQISMSADKINVTNMNISNLNLGSNGDLLMINANTNLTFKDSSIVNVTSDYQTTIDYDSILGYIYRHDEAASSCGMLFEASEFLDISNVTINNVISKGGESTFLEVTGGNIYFKDISLTNSNVSGGEGNAFHISGENQVIVENVLFDNVQVPERNITTYDDSLRRYTWKYTNDPGEGDGLGMEISGNDVTFTNVNLTNMGMGVYGNLLSISSRNNLTFRDVLIENITSRYSIWAEEYDEYSGGYYYSETFEGACCGVELNAGETADVFNLIMNQVWSKGNEEFFIVSGQDIGAQDIIITNSNISSGQPVSFNAYNNLTVKNFIIDNCTSAYGTEGSITYDRYYGKYIMRSEGISEGFNVEMISNNHADISNVILTNLFNAGSYPDLLVISSGTLTLDNVLIENITPVMRTEIEYDEGLGENIYENSTTFSSTGLQIRVYDNGNISNVKLNNIVEPDETDLLTISGGDLTLRNVTVSNTTYQVYSMTYYDQSYGKYVTYENSDFEGVMKISGNVLDIDNLILESIQGIEFIVCIEGNNVTINNSHVMNFVTDISYRNYNNDLLDYVYTYWTWGNVLYVSADNVLIQNTLFENITAGNNPDEDNGWGHALRVYSPNSTISNCTFKDIKSICNVTEFDNTYWTYNSLPGETKGSALYFEDETYGNIIDSSFINCSADYGGAIYAFRPLNITGSEFIDCIAKSGGAIYIDGEGLFVNNTLFKGNKAINGGALFFTNQSINNTVYNATFIKNIAENNGGAVYIFESENEGVNIINASVFYYNHADYNGGAFFFNDTINHIIWDDYRWHNATVSSKIHDDLTFVSSPLARTMIIFNEFEKNSDYALNITAHNNAIGGNHTVTITVKDDAKGYVHVNITDKNGNFIKDKQGNEINGEYQLVNGSVLLELEDLPIGDYNVSAYYSSWDYYEYPLYYHINSTIFSIYPHDLNVSANKTIFADENLTVIAKLNNLTTGTVNITVSNENYTFTFSEIPIVNGTVNYNITGLYAGKYNVTVTYNGDDIFYVKSNTTDATVIKRQSKVDVSVRDNVYGNVTKIIVKVPENQVGNVTVEINNQTYTKEVTNGTVEFEIPGLAAGECEANVTFNENRIYAENNTIFKFNVAKANLTVNVTGNNVTVKDNASFNIEVPEDFKGNVTITIDGQKYYDGPVSDLVNITSLPAGDYTANLGFYGDSNYNDTNVDVNFTVSPVEPEMNVTITNATYGGNATATVIVSGNANGTVNITVDGKTYTGKVVNGTATITLDNLTAGVKEADAKFITSDRYNSNTTATATFNVDKINSTIIISNINSTAIIEVLDNATGNVTIYVNGEKYIRGIDNNPIVLEDVLIAGDNSIVAIYDGDANYYGSENATKIILPLKIIVTDLIADEKRVIINVTGISSGNVTVVVDNGQRNITKNLTSGNAIFDLTDLSHDIHTIDIYCPDGTVEEMELDGRVNETLNISTIKSEDMKRGYNSPYDYQAAFLDKQGNALVNATVIFKVNGKEYNATTDDEGVAQLYAKLDVGKYNITSINLLTGEKVTNELEIVKRILENKDLTADFNDGSKFVVKVIGDDGNIAPEGDIVDISVNGVHYVAKVGKNGYASLTVKLIPKKYKITAEYKEFKTTNKLVVKQILKAVKKTTTIKKGKKLVLKAKLKLSNGKALKGKVINFKFKGKTYKAKTNKKGIAKVTIKKKVTKKLKKGKKYKVTISYNVKDKYASGYVTISDKVKCFVKVKK